MDPFKKSLSNLLPIISNSKSIKCRHRGFYNPLLMNTTTSVEWNVVPRELNWLKYWFETIKQEIDADFLLITADSVRKKDTKKRVTCFKELNCSNLKYDSYSEGNPKKSNKILWTPLVQGNINSNNLTYIYLENPINPVEKPNKKSMKSMKSSSSRSRKMVGRGSDFLLGTDLYVS